MRNGSPRRRAEIARGAQRVSKERGELRAWVEKLARQTREHPGRSVAMAVGVGYVMGGGLFSRLTARIVGTAIRIGLRTALLPFVTEGLLVLGQKHPTQRET